MKKLFAALVLCLLASPALAQVNMAGAEFATSGTRSKIPGVIGSDYVYATNSQIDAVMQKGWKHIRIPIRHERIVTGLMGDFRAADIAELDRMIARVISNGGSVNIDVHNYGGFKFNNTDIGYYNHNRTGATNLPPDGIVDLWKRLAERYKSLTAVSFGIMNEPNRQSASEWRVVADAIVAGIRSTGATNLITVPGTSWTGAHSWMRSGNAAAMQSFTDTNYAFEMHQYFDADSSGTSADCVSATIGSERLKAATEWMRAKGAKGYLGEYGVADNPTCLAALQDMATYMRANADVWMGSAYWAAGPWWGNYKYSVHPPKGANQTAVVLAAPLPTPDPTPTPDPIPDPTPTPDPIPDPTPDPTPAPAGKCSMAVGAFTATWDCVIK